MIKQESCTYIKSDERIDCSTDMCYFGCNKCGVCIYNQSMYKDGLYTIYCVKKRYERSFLKRLRNALKSDK
jgi:hypothetical protein